MKLHEVIADVLNNTDKHLSVRNIAEIINKGNLWKRPKDGKAPNQTQVSARINNYPHLFLRENGVVSLITQTSMEKRLFRLTWNESQWEYPSGHIYDTKKQGKTDVAYENQYGFGFEEWLFNPRFQLDGFQYGYIRGINNVKQDVEVIDQAYLFTIDPHNKSRYLVGILADVEIILGYPKGEKIAKKLFQKYFDVMKDDLKSVNADVKGLNEGEFGNIRFKIAGNQLFETPILIPGLKGNKYNRFQPYILDKELDEIINGFLPKQKFIFKSGIAKNKKTFDKTTSASTKTIARVHSEITDSLIDYLKPNFSLVKKNISVESTYFGSNIADIVLKHEDDEITIIEVKTSNNIRKNIREALGQLLDYAFWYEDLKVKNLIIVSPSFLEEDEFSTLKRIKSNLKIKTSYWQFITNTKAKEIKFKEVL